MKSWKVHIILFAALMLGLSSYAQVSFKGSANKTKLDKNETFKLEFEINSKARNFKGPLLTSDFIVIQGPTQSQETYIDNYGLRYKQGYTYLLKPRRTGTFTIGSATIRAEGQTYRTKPITITVLEKSPRPVDPNDPQAIAESSAFFRILTSKRKLYVGEPVVASYKVYFNRAIGNPQILDEPNFTGYFREDIEIKRVNTSTENYDGQRFNTGVIRQLVLIPQTTGKQSIGEVEMQIPVQVPTRRRDFFGQRLNRTITVNSSKAFPQLDVLPLPEAGRPSNFTGAVGQYTMEVSLNRNEVTADESVTLKITLKGSGNIKLAEFPEPEIPNAFEVYDPKTSENISITAAGMSGRKTYEYLLIPRYNGTYKIPEIRFSYFDTKAKRYKTLSSPEQEITVTGGQAQPRGQGGLVAGSKESVNYIGKDILFIKTDIGRVQKEGQGFFASSTFKWLLGGSSLAWLVLLGFQLVSSNRQVDQRKAQRSKANKVARKHLSAAQKQLKEQQTDIFYQELSTALWGYFADKFNIPQSQIGKDTIKEQLEAKGVEEALVKQVLELLDRAEMARFTSINAAQPEQDYEDTVDLITEIEKLV